MAMDLADALPEIPTFSDELIDRCKQSKDFCPILFEWYKYVGVLCNTAACLVAESPAFRRIPPVHYAVLVGLLNRCSRLMLANVRLSCTGRYGETTRLLDRSIAETAIKVQWLCYKGDDDSFLRYLADGLKNDLKLKKEIEDNIKNRGGDTLVIEESMLRSIQNCISLSGLSEQQVTEAKKLPDFASMSNDLGLGESFYLVIQRIGSHAVHGTWSDLIFNYLELEEKTLKPRDHEIATQDVQYIAICLFVAEAIESFLNYVALNPAEVQDILSPVKAAKKEITEIMKLAWAPQFNRA